MTKELRMTNIEFLKEHIRQLKEVLFDDNVPKHIIESVEHELSYWQPVLNDLLELQAIKGSEPSEALECLGNIRDTVSVANELLKVEDTNAIDKRFDTIKQALLKAEKLEKALEIITFKKVDIQRLLFMGTCEDYNAWCGITLDRELTEEEFELIKEMIE